MISNRSLTTSYNNTTPRIPIERNHPAPKHPSNLPPSPMMKPSHYETHTHSSYQYYPSEYQCCQDYQYAVPANPQIHSCMYSTYHAAPCFTASTSHSGTFTSPSSSFAVPTGERCNNRDPYNYSWDSSMHDAVSPQRCSESVSPAESSDSDLSCMAQDEQQPSSVTDITYRTFITYMPPLSSADANDVPMSDPFSRQQYPSHNLHHVSAASQANSTSSSRLDYDSSVGSALSHQPIPDTPPAFVFKEPITLHHPRPRRLFLNRLLTETIPFDEEPVIQSCKAPEGVQRHPLSPNSLLCQPAPPSVMFPADAGVDENCLPDAAFQDATSCSNFPYDHNELAQNAVVCTCGCMGSYYMTH